MATYILLIDGPHLGTRMTDESDSPAPIEGDTVEVDGVTYTFTGKVSVNIADRPDLTEHLATADPLELFRWFDSLHPATKFKLSSDSYGAVPAEAIPDVLAAGQLVGGVFRPGSTAGPNGFFLAYETMEWIDRHFPSRTNRADLRCPECSGPWVRNFEFSHAHDCELGASDRERIERAGTSVRGTSDAEHRFAEALGKLPIAAQFRAPWAPIPVSDPYLTETVIDTDGTVHRTVDGFHPD